ncbi:hypothetical protein EN875_032235 [Mesorhizobium sp. M2D.F.Ca.ET.232.01.1.1]|uniref:hypothetical protein n=1 Tax=Mesorhizobium sp. M2D.F.Ca.ET.232.01.1.1 TaxID=2496670 RepID=UPI000FCC6381|nr:hypothetical protein [Mesorhizobium sp. M2D.F.Ca.ET.232.01.1.1]TGP28228.1 hypothetical protein EN875_032235 [Mesorhizobium sp. M2D.F.Ca.ET.232.01.1.1]
MSRPVRDILAECMRRERVGLVRPLWHDFVATNDEACEQVRLRADHLTRLLASYGLTIVQTEDARAPETPPDTIYRCALEDGTAERVIRRAGDGWEVVKVAGGVETVEQSFMLDRAAINAGLVLTDAPEAKSISGLGRQLAALVEIFRVHAQGMAK